MSGGELVRDSRGRWCVASPIEGLTYEPTTGTRVIRAVPVGASATRAEAERAARAAGMLHGEREEEV